MATKKAAATGTEPTTKAPETPETPEPGTTRTGVDIPPGAREVLRQPIDDRMAALLKDHQDMGARPK